MLQFYFLAVFLNALTGYMLITGDSDNALEFKSNFSVMDETFRLIIGVLSVVTGLLKLLSPIEGDIPVIGDLIPAISCFLTGFILIFEFYKSRSTLDETENAEKINQVLVRNKKIVGIAAVAAAVLHFLFPKVLLL